MSTAHTPRSTGDGEAGQIKDAQIIMDTMGFMMHRVRFRVPAHNNTVPR